MNRKRPMTNSQATLKEKIVERGAERVRDERDCPEEGARRTERGVLVPSRHVESDEPAGAERRSDDDVTGGTGVLILSQRLSGTRFADARPEATEEPTRGSLGV